MDANEARRSATRVGLITLPIGIALSIRPGDSGRLLRIGGRPAVLRAIGIADLALVPGLIASRHRWQYMTARAGLNLTIAAYCLSVVRRDRKAVGAMAGAAAMIVATITDGRTIVALRRAGRELSSVNHQPSRQ